MIHHTHLTLLPLSPCQLMSRDSGTLFESELPVRADLYNIAVIQEEARSHLWPGTYGLPIHICAIDGLPVPHINMVGNRWLVNNGVHLAVVT